MIQQISLSDVYWFQEGPGVRNWQFKDNGIKLLNVANITKQGTIDLDKTDRYLSKEEVDSKYSHFLIDEGDLVIASSGITNDTDDLLRTKIAFIKKEHLPLCLNTSTIRFKAKEGVSDLRYLKHWLNSLEFRQQITKEVTGIAQKNFGPSHLKRIKISLPPIEEQCRIAFILDKADELRQKRQQAIERLDQFLVSEFMNKFHQKNYSELKVSELLENEKSMRTGPFGSQLLHSEFVEKGIHVLGIDNAVQNCFNWAKPRFITEEKYKTLKRYTVKPKDVLITIMGTCGKCAVVPEDIPIAINTKHLCCITLDQNKCNPEFLHSYFLIHPTARNYLESRAKGAIMSGLNMGIIKELPVELPPLEKQNEFSKLKQKVILQKDLMLIELSKINNLFASLQNQAFSGNL